MADEERSPERAGLSRRGFLKGMGATTAASGFLGGAVQTPATAQDAQPELKGPGEIPVTLSINGKKRSLNVEPRVTLLDALRNRLHLTGSKKVCDRGTCGACTVLVDDEPHYACSMLAVDAEDRKITTIEGLGSPEQMHAIQEAFVAHDAQQCGFCTPGFVVACTAFLRDHPEPTREAVRAGLGGNLCRCGTYAGIQDAVLEAAKAVKGGG